VSNESNIRGESKANDTWIPLSEAVTAALEAAIIAMGVNR